MNDSSAAWGVRSWWLWLASGLGWAVVAAVAYLPMLFVLVDWPSYAVWQVVRHYLASWLATPLIFEWVGRCDRWRGLRYWLYLAVGGVAACVLARFAVASLIATWSGAWSLVAPFSALPSLIVNTSMPLIALAAATRQYRLAGQRRRALKDAQLRVLRAQLQPHFLFNTLHAIGVTAKADGATAARMTTLLGDLLRQTLRERDGELVSLAEERELLQPYLQLQQLRFGDRLRVELDLPDDVLGAAVPDLILQPLVENALRHGIEQLPGAGHVVVRARRVADALELQVADDGAGPAAATRDGIGLGGTRARLQAIYGNAADVQLAPGGVRGTVATLRVPFREVAHAA